jgi:hypothetical protein
MLKKIFPYEDFLYILQLEEYYYNRYFRKVFDLFLKRGFMIHEKLVFTSRIQVTYFLSIFITIYLPTIFALLILGYSHGVSYWLIEFVLLIASIIFIPLSA